MNEHKFENFGELESIANTLDQCRRTESIYRAGNGDIVVDPLRKDIINLKTGTRSAVVSKVYHEYQHRDVIEEVARSFQKAKIEGHGFVYDNGDRIMAACFFDNIEAIRDPTSQKGIKIGAMFRNSYNKQNSVTGSGYFMRLECLNQMYFGNMIHELKFSERHTGSIVQALPNSIADFTDRLLMRSKLVAKAIDTSAGIRIKFESREQKLQTMVALVDHNKVGEMIAERIETLNPTKWDIYNAITESTTHDPMAEGVRARVEKFSESVLSPDRYIIPAVLV